MTLSAAITARHNVRAFKDQPLAEDVVKELEDKIEKLNRQGRCIYNLSGMSQKHFWGRWPNMESSVI